MAVLCYHILWHRFGHDIQLGKFQTRSSIHLLGKNKKKLRIRNGLQNRDIATQLQLRGVEYRLEHIVGEIRIE